MAKLHLDENFDNVQVEVQACVDPVFVNANKEHDENKENYEAAMEANEEATEGLTPEEGESIEVDKRDVLKKMHLEESLFGEEAKEKIKLNAEQKENALVGLDIDTSEITDMDSFMSQDWFLVKRTEGDIEDYPYTLMIGKDAWDDVTPYGFKSIIGELNEDFNKGDKFRNQNDATIKIVGADDDLVVFKVATKDDAIGEIRSTTPKSMENVIGMNGYEKISESVESDKLKSIYDFEDGTQFVATKDINLGDVEDWEWEGFDSHLKTSGDNAIIPKGSVVTMISAYGPGGGWPQVSVDGGDDFDLVVEEDESIEEIGLKPLANVSESMEEIDRQVFGSLNKETREPGVYYVLVDQNFDHKIYADSDEEAIEKFRAQLNESFNHFESDNLEERKRIVKLMHETMQSMQDEEAYFEWIYTMPDEPDEDDFEWFAEDATEYEDLCNEFEKLFDRYKKYGLYEPSKEVTDFLDEIGYIIDIDEAYDSNLGGDKDDFISDLDDLENAVKNVSIGSLRSEECQRAILENIDFYRRRYLNEEYDPDLGGDTDDYKLDVESIKKALNGLQFGTLRAEGLVDEFIDTLENWMPVDESLNESAKAFSSLELEVMDILRRNGYKIYPTDIEAYADYIKMIRKETGEDYSVAQWFKDTEAMSKEESGLEEVDDDLEESLIYNVAKEQLKRFNEGKMGDSWNPKIYLERLESKKYLNKEQIKNLTESLNIKEENSLE